MKLKLLCVGLEYIKRYDKAAALELEQGTQATHRQQECFIYL